MRCIYAVEVETGSDFVEVFRMELFVLSAALHIFYLNVI